MWGGKQLAKLGGESTSALTISGNPGDIMLIAIPFRCRPIRAGFTITTAITIQDAIINFDSIIYKATGDQTRGDCDVGQITLPTGAYRNKCYYDETDYGDAVTSPTWKGSLKEGDVVAVQVYQSPTAGAGLPFIIVEIDPELPANNSNMVKSA